MYRHFETVINGKSYDVVTLNGRVVGITRNRFSKRKTKALSFVFALCALLFALSARPAQAQFVDRIVRPCPSGSPAQASVIVNPNSTGDIKATTCSGGTFDVNGVPVTPGPPPPSLSCPGCTAGVIPYFASPDLADSPFRRLSATHVDLFTGGVGGFDFDSSTPAITLNSGSGVATIGDPNFAGNGVTLVVDNPANKVTINSLLDVSQLNAFVVQANAVFPSFAGAGSIGTTSLPYGGVIVGLNPNNTSTLNCNTCTADRVVNLPDANITIPVSFGAPLTVLENNTALAATTGTVYSSPGYSGTPLSAITEGDVSWACPRAGTISALYVRTGSVVKVNTPATVITVRKNGANTTLTITMTQTVNTTTSDTTHSFTVAAGDLITVSFLTTGAAGVSTSIAGISFLLN